MSESRLPRWLAVAPFVLGFVVLTGLLLFPLDAWIGHFRETRYGLSSQTFAAWTQEYAIIFGIDLVVALIAYSALVYIIRALKQTWWIWGGVLALVVLGSFIALAPVYLAPLTNEYAAMEDGPLKQDILLMAEAAGIPADDVYVYDRSRQTNTISANVSGVFGTSRISLADTLLRDGTPEEVRAVMAHEIGHYVLGHSWDYILKMGLLYMLGFAFVHVSFNALVRTIGKSWGVRDIGDVAGLPLLVALVTVYFLAITPITNTISRSNELEADAYGLALAREPDGFAGIALKLGTYRKLDPGPVERFVFHHHPTGRERVEMAMRFKAAQLAAGAQDIDPAPAPLADEVRRYAAERKTSAAR